MVISRSPSKTHSLLENIREKHKKLEVGGKDPRFFLEPMLEYYRQHPLNVGGLAKHLGVTRKEAVDLTRTFCDKVIEIEEDFLDEMEEKIILCGLGRAGEFRIGDALTVLERRRPAKWSKTGSAVGKKGKKRTAADDYESDGPRDESWRSEIRRFQRVNQRPSVRIEAKGERETIGSSDEGSDGSGGEG